MYSRREYFEYSCKRLKLAQVLGQLRVFLTTRAARSPHTQSHPAQRSVQHPMQDYGVPARSHDRVKAQCNTSCRTTASPHAVTSSSKISATPHAGLRRPHTQSRPGQGSVQHTEPWTAASQHAINAGSKIEVQHPMQDYGVPARSHGRVKAQCNTPCRALASPHAVTAGSRLSATPYTRPYVRERVHIC